MDKKVLVLDRRMSHVEDAEELARLGFKVVFVESLEGIKQIGDVPLRDYFASKAMQSLVGGTGWVEEMEHIPIKAYQIADAMLKEREAKDQNHSLGGNDEEDL